MDPGENREENQAGSPPKKSPRNMESVRKKIPGIASRQSGVFLNY